jgi:plasmid maintenance system antidote protein VapI
MSKKNTSWKSILQTAIMQSGKSTYAVAKEAGLDVTQLYRFMNNERGLSIDTAERVGKVVGVELRQIKGGGKL